MTVYDDGSNNVIFSFDGIHDALYGGDGNDRMGGTFAGTLMIDGGRGSDQIFISAIVPTMAVIYGGDGDDAAFGNNLSDRLYGGDGDDLLTGHAATNRNALVQPSVPEASGNDELYGGAGRDALYGFDGDDQIYGGSGDDSGTIRVAGDGFSFNPTPANTETPQAGLHGGAGDDYLDGGSGNDLISGGLGRDVMLGGTGRDTFDFDSETESLKGKLRDVIRDFDRKEGDVIDLAGIDAKTGGEDNEFKYIGAQGFHDRKSELRFKNGKVAGDTDGDGKADFEIGVLGPKKLSSEDFSI
jgi:Ca2+-binding RTX toxin-like protein